MRIIYVDVPTYLKKIIFLVSLLFKDTYFFNLNDVSSSEYLYKKKIKPISFENKKFKNIENYIFGINSKLEKHLKSFFFHDLKKKLKEYLNKNYSEKGIYLSLQQKIIPLSNYTGKLKVWLDNNKIKKTYVIFFHSDFFYAPPINNETKKIIIPLNLLNFISIKLMKKKISIFKKKEKIFSNKKNHIIKPILYLINQSIVYGSNRYKLFKKNILIDNESKVTKYLDICYINEKPKITFQQKLFFFFESFNLFFMLFFKTIKFKNWLSIIFFIKIIYLIKNFNHHFKNKNYKSCYVDYDILMPSYIYWSLKSLNTKIFSYQDRFNLGFKTSRITIFCDYYFVNNPYQIKKFKKSKNITAKEFTQIGQIKSEYLVQLLKKNNKPKNIFKKKITVFGYNSSINKFRALHEPLTNWQSQKFFLNDMILLSKKFTDCLVVLRFKSLEWLINNNYFKTELKQIQKIKNIMISKNYEYNQSYELCSSSDLIISRWSSISDENLCAGKSVIIYNYAGFSTNLIKKYFDYGNKINAPNLNKLIKLVDVKLNSRKYKKYEANFAKKYYGLLEKKKIIQNLK